MIFKDDRSEEQFKTHTVLITARDKFLSGWGLANKGYSYCAWAVKPEDSQEMLSWVESRNDMVYVNLNGPKWKPRNKNAAHCHIYVANRGNHPALPN